MLLILRVKLLMYRLHGMFYMKEVIMEGHLERISFPLEINRKKGLHFEKSHVNLSDEFWKTVFSQWNQNLIFSGVMDDNVCRESQALNWKNDS